MILCANSVILGDSLDVLSRLPDGSVHLTFTSPPYYNARGYASYTTYEAYLDTIEAVLAEVRRVTFEGRYLVLNTSPVLVPRERRQDKSQRFGIPFDLHPRLVQAGWDFVDDILWVKPEMSAKGRARGFYMNRKPLAYKPNIRTEYLMVYRKRTDRLIDWNLRQYSISAVEDSLVHGDIETSNVWDIAPASDQVHSAVFPQELCDRVIRYYSMAGDLVLDPFAGSGTLALSAMTWGRDFFLVERDTDYFNRIIGKLGSLSRTGGPIQYMSLEQWDKLIELGGV